MPPRRPSVLCDGHLSPSTLVVCDHPAALRSIRCWVVPGRDSSTPPPGRTPPEVFRASRRQPFRLLAQTVSGFRFATPATDCAGATVPGFASNVVPRFGQWAVPAQGGEAVCLPFASGLFNSAVKPASGLADAPFQSPAASTHQTASPPTLHFVPRPMALPDS